jgi:excinuclease UvrABC ATPase subunit
MTDQDKIAELILEYPPEFKKSMRRQYLLGYYRKAFHKQYLKSRKYIEDMVVKSLYFIEMRDKAIATYDLSAVVCCNDRIKELVDILVKVHNSAYYRRQNMDGDVTKNMIRRAKDFPFSELIELKRNMACCPFHQESKPSFSVHNNRGNCFGCQWKGDTIDFLMKRDSLTFPEAIKRLQ